MLNPRFGVRTSEPPLDRLIVGGGEHPCVLAGPPVSRRRGRGRAARRRRADRSRLAGGRLPDGRAGRCSRCRARTTRPASSSRSPRRRRWSTPRAASSFATPCSWPGGRLRRLATLGADSLALSAHKIGGPKGAGALVVARTPTSSVGEPLMRGGGQERGVRAGTENVAAIAGFGAAARAAAAEAASERRAARWRCAIVLLERGPRRRPGRGRLRRSRAAAAQHAVLRRPRGRGGDPDDRARSRRRRGQLGRGLLVGQGDAVARAGGDGGRAGIGARRDPAEPRMGVVREATSSASRRRSPARSGGMRGRTWGAL